jgi:Flp pilus assembly protein TadG
MSYRNSKKKILRCVSGITSIEFAMVVPVMMLLIMGIIEFSLIMFTNAVLENAANVTARYGATGFVAAGSSRQDQIIANVRNMTGGLLDPDRIIITTTVYASFDQVERPETCINPATAPCPGTAGVNYVDINGNGQWDADMGVAGLGNANDIVVYQITYPWPVTTPVINTIIGNPFNITVRTVVKNEPYT